MAGDERCKDTNLCPHFCCWQRHLITFYYRVPHLCRIRLAIGLTFAGFLCNTPLLLQDQVRAAPHGWRRVVHLPQLRLHALPV
jgi:hypothetical protein